MKRKLKLRKIILFILIFNLSLYNFLFNLPQKSELDSANFTNASVTLSNSRLSYRAGVATGAANGSVITIDSSGNADNNTTHLFPKDVVCFAGPNLDGCYNQSTYNVVNVVDSSTFNISPPLGATALGANDYVISTQSAIHTITFTLTNAVPSNGDIYITIPSIDHATQGNDGFPDTNSSIATNGFDLNGLGISNITVSSSGSSCNNNWTVAAVTPGDASNDHQIRIDRTTDSCAAGSTITVTIGDTNRQLINPAPILSGHTQGLADVYTINVKTRDGLDYTLDESNIKIAVVEGVLVSATVQETLSLTIAGVPSSTSACGQTTDVTTTATSVPWGTIINFGAFQEAAQTVTISTNAASGYNVNIEENDQMGKDGKVCTGASAGEADQCIQDTVCGPTACNESTSQDWISTSYYGLGYSLANVSGNNAAFTYNESGRTFSARQFADQEAAETKQTIMSAATPVASSQVYVCYRLNVSATQPAGYYFNKVRYTATASF
ncbi:MAG: hypothetical protein KatS3mg092_0472 [Patescibacteria group bacterium]|nr:MAG: hypothetical protein KatS3mg092_0472 [Patescibacteria group bacterium]